MAARRRRERAPLNADINVVSLIDVMMLLMIIFMLTAPMMQGGVDVALPRAAARPLTTRSGVTVTLARDVRASGHRRPRAWQLHRVDHRAGSAREALRRMCACILLARSDVLIVLTVYRCQDAVPPLRYLRFHR